MRRQVSRGAGGREGARGRGLPPAAASCHGRQALGGTVLEGRGPGEGNPGRCHHSWVLGKQQCWVFSFAFHFSLFFFSQLFVRPPQTAILLFRNSFS